MLLKEYKETNDYLTLGKNDCFDYEAGIANLTCWADLGDIFQGLFETTENSPKNTSHQFVAGLQIQNENSKPTQKRKTQKTEELRGVFSPVLPFPFPISLAIICVTEGDRTTGKIIDKFCWNSPVHALQIELIRKEALFLGNKSVNTIHTVTNDTEETIYDIYVVFALLDDEDNILYVDSNYMGYDRGLTPGSSVVFREYVGNEFLDYYEDKGITPAKVDAAAYVDIFHK